MIKGTATIQFGSGSVASAIGVDPDSGNGVIFMRSIAPGKIGRDLGEEISCDFVAENAEVVVYFTNLEGLDSQINTLKTLREEMIKAKEATE